MEKLRTPNTVEIKVPATDPKTKEYMEMPAFGKVAWFQIGGQRYKFLLQERAYTQSSVQLTHFASGHTVLRSNVISAMKVRHMHGGKTVTTREACRLALGELEKRIGLSKMITVFAAAPIINK